MKVKYIGKISHPLELIHGRIQQHSKTAKDRVSAAQKLIMVDNSGESSIIKNTSGKNVIIVSKTNLYEKPNSITQRIGKKGGIERNYYDENGRQYKQISNNDHGNPGAHPFGKKGEHAHDYVYDENGNLKERIIRELTDSERKENDDIL